MLQLLPWRLEEGGEHLLTICYTWPHGYVLALAATEWRQSEKFSSSRLCRQVVAAAAVKDPHCLLRAFYYVLLLSPHQSSLTTSMAQLVGRSRHRRYYESYWRHCLIGVYLFKCAHVVVILQWPTPPPHNRYTLMIQAFLFFFFWPL